MWKWIKRTLRFILRIRGNPDLPPAVVLGVDLEGLTRDILGALEDRILDAAILVARIAAPDPVAGRDLDLANVIVPGSEEDLPLVKEDLLEG